MHSEGGLARQAEKARKTKVISGFDKAHQDPCMGWAGGGSFLLFPFYWA